ncbi:unnamed protein product [Alopecurus aequalis]
MALLTDWVAHSGHVPSSHIRAVGDRPDLAKVDHKSGACIPVIDLEHLDGPGRGRVVEAIGYACETDGFFMVKNHGIPESVMEGMMLHVAREFFHLPESERLKCCSDDPDKAIRLSTSFNVPAERVSNWRDVLRLHCYPLESFVDQWPPNPPVFREVVGTYSTEARALALRLLEAISESLGLERDHMVNAMGRHAQQMALNYYPPCPQPELTYGLPGHRDCNAITLLLQDGVSGLQVQRDGRWVAVDSVPNVLFINIGDALQVLSNDRYKSASHRAIVNSESERISVPTFYCPSSDTVVAPAGALVDDDHCHPLAYRPFTYQEYTEEYWKTGLDSASCLNRFRHI